MASVATPPSSPSTDATAPADPPRSRPLNVAQWLKSIGDVSPERVLLDPPPGTVTLEDYVKLDGRVEGRLVELIDNTLVEKPMGRDESAIAIEVAAVVRNFIKERKLGGRLSGEAGMVRMKGSNVRMPDVCWTAPQDIRQDDRGQAAPRDVPTLAIEVISESNTKNEIDLKLREFFDSGCRLAWVLYPTTRTVRVYDDPKSLDRFRQLAADDTLEGGDVLPGFSVKVGELFEI